MPPKAILMLPPVLITVGAAVAIHQITALQTAVDSQASPHSAENAA